MNNPNRKQAAETLAHTLAAAIALQKFHTDTHAQQGGEIITAGVTLLLVRLLGEGEAMDLLEDAYDILNAGPLKGTGLLVTTQRKLARDSHTTTEDMLQQMRDRGMI